LGFRGFRHSTNYAIQVIAKNDIQITIQPIIKSIEVKIKGLGYGKEYSLCGLRLRGLIITRIQDVSPMPNNGCWPAKKHRV
jgi:small subunit ribosomal protein S11